MAAESQKKVFPFITTEDEAILHEKGVSVKNRTRQERKKREEITTPPMTDDSLNRGTVSQQKGCPSKGLSMKEKRRLAARKSRLERNTAKKQLPSS